MGYLGKVAAAFLVGKHSFYIKNDFERLFLEPGILQVFFHTGLYCDKQVFSFEIRADIIIRKHSALFWAGIMDRTPFYHPVAALKYTGSIILDLKGIFIFQITFPNFTI